VTSLHPHQLIKDTGFLRAAVCFWGRVFPFARREIKAWERRADAIPDQRLRAIALGALRHERGNLEGATAFATFVSGSHRRHVARAAIAFQAAYDYVDAVSERAFGAGPVNTRQLHMALLIAVSPSVAHLNYYEHEMPGCDGGYLAALVDGCRESLTFLPSHRSAADEIKKATGRIIDYQDFNHRSDEFQALALWATRETPPGADLRWWETGAAAGSSLGVFALMAAAAKPQLPRGATTTLANAYFPWIGSLHTLLDSLVDEQEDRMAHQQSLISLYSTPEEMAGRIGSLVEIAKHRALALPESHGHMLILAAMVSFYLSLPQASGLSAQLPNRLALLALGEHTRAPMFVLKTRARVNRICRLTLSHAAPLVRFILFGFGLVRRR
jgi:tetraprenyl-beta-curcumene synthase